ncbi:H-NS family nucleoid-associated regulatory protein [Variovorax ureilyticus]|uniref:H-NS family nucleoid-associated regulatory protein n=1 Tax=Variovorax ureilyticus TaxID=1836198 RepID=A0ABU8VKC6_9BURK
MAQTYLQVQKQIQTLQREAEKLRMREMSGVIDRIKVAIAEYGITAKQLGFSSASRSVAVKKNSGKAPSSGKAKYANGQGQAWGGMGPRPAWLRAELDAGKELEDFLVGKASAKAKPASSKTRPAATKPVSAKVSKGAQKRRAKKQYADPASGKRWAGMGPQPKWLKDLVASGKTLEELAV